MTDERYAELEEVLKRNTLCPPPEWSVLYEPIGLDVLVDDDVADWELREEPRRHLAMSGEAMADIRRRIDQEPP